MGNGLGGWGWWGAEAGKGGDDSRAGGLRASVRGELQMRRAEGE